MYSRYLENLDTDRKCVEQYFADDRWNDAGTQHTKTSVCSSPDPVQHRTE